MFSETTLHNYLECVGMEHYIIRWQGRQITHLKFKLSSSQELLQCLFLFASIIWAICFLIRSTPLTLSSGLEVLYFSDIFSILTSWFSMTFSSFLFSFSRASSLETRILCIWGVCGQTYNHPHTCNILFQWKICRPLDASSDTFCYHTPQEDKFP